MTLSQTRPGCSGATPVDALSDRARKAEARVKTLLLAGGAPGAHTSDRQVGNADMVVMGTHGHTGLRRLFLGTVAERVVASATCPVMTVRGKSAR